MTPNKKSSILADQNLQTAKELIESANYIEAIDLLQQAALVYRQLEKGKDLAKTLFIQAQTQLLLHDTQEAKKLTQELHQTIREYTLTDQILQANAQRLDAQILENEGQYANAISIYSKLLQELQNALPKTANELAATYNNLSSCYYNIGEASKAIDNLQKAVGILEEHDSTNLKELATYYSNLGASYNNTENYDKAILYAQKSLAIRKQLFQKDNLETAYSYNHLGASYVGKQDFAKAIQYFHQFLDINLELFGEEHINVAMACGNLAGCYKSISQLETALKYWHRSANIVQRLLGESHPYTAIIYNNLGVGYKEIGENDKALQYFQNALQIEKQLYGHKHHQLARSLLNIAAIYTSQKNYSSTIDCIQKAIIALVHDFNETNIAANPKFKIWTGQMYLLEALSEKAKVLYQWFLVEKEEKYLQYSADSFEVVLQLIDLIRRSYDLEASHLDLSKRVKTIYNDAIEVALLQYQISQNEAYLHKAFNFSEKIKAILLFTKLQETKAKLETDIAPQLRHKETVLRSQLSQTQQNIAQLIAEGTPKDDPKVLELQSQYFDDNQAYEKLIQHFETAYPKYYQLKYSVKAVSVSEIQTSLQKNQWLISYFVGETNIHVFCIGRQDFKVKSIAKPIDFEHLIKRLGSSIKTLHKKRYLQTAYQLYQLLLQSVVEEMPKTSMIPQLTIIPHDLLTTLPFEALLCSQAENVLEPYCNFDYVLKHFHVGYHYSATLWWSILRASNKTNSSNDNFVGFAPVYSNIHREKTPIEGNENRAYSTKNVAAMRSVTVRGQKFEALKYSEEEVNGIQATFAAKGLETETFLHQKATKTQFIAASKGKKYLLIAAHGIYNPEHPELSGIIFSPDNESNTEDAILYTQEAYHLQLDADLVVLSSCESGIGTLEVGEGMMAINRGFLYAGAKNVIFTLFKIYDQQSSQLTQLLFEAILEDLSRNIGRRNYATALRWAKLQLVQQKDIDPSAWTGFVLIGI